MGGITSKDRDGALSAFFSSGKVTPQPQQEPQLPPEVQPQPPADEEQAAHIVSALRCFQCRGLATHVAHCKDGTDVAFCRKCFQPTFGPPGTEFSRLINPQKRGRKPGSSLARPSVSEQEASGQEKEIDLEVCVYCGKQSTNTATRVKDNVLIGFCTECVPNPDSMLSLKDVEKIRRNVRSDRTRAIHKNAAALLAKLTKKHFPPAGPSSDNSDD